VADTRNYRPKTDHALLEALLVRMSDGALTEKQGADQAIKRPISAVRSRSVSGAGAISEADVSAANSAIAC